MSIHATREPWTPVLNDLETTGLRPRRFSLENSRAAPLPPSRGLVPVIPQGTIRHDRQSVAWLVEPAWKAIVTLLWVPFAVSLSRSWRPHRLSSSAREKERSRERERNKEQPFPSRNYNYPFVAKRPRLFLPSPCFSSRLSYPSFFLIVVRAAHWFLSFLFASPLINSLWLPPSSPSFNNRSVLLQLIHRPLTTVLVAPTPLSPPLFFSFLPVHWFSSSSSTLSRLHAPRSFHRIFIFFFQRRLSPPSSALGGEARIRRSAGTSVGPHTENPKRGAGERMRVKWPEHDSRDSLVQWGAREFQPCEGCFVLLVCPAWRVGAVPLRIINILVNRKAAQVLGSVKICEFSLFFFFF